MPFPAVAAKFFEGWVVEAHILDNRFLAGLSVRFGMTGLWEVAVIAALEALRHPKAIRHKFFGNP